MKTNKMSAIFALAFAAFAAVPQAAMASTGDIVDIRAVDTDTMKFGARNLLSGDLCTASNPLTAGDDLYIRVRMLVSNYSDVSASKGTSSEIAPLVWYFAPGIGAGTDAATSLYKPKLGLWIGNRVAYAEYSDTGFYSWQQSGTLVTDDAGNSDTSWNYYTDLYFVYTIQPGDIGLPVRLANGAASGAASNSDTDASYSLLNCGDSALTAYWVLQNSEGTVAKFWYGADDLPLDIGWPTGVSGDTALRNYDLSAEGAYVKTVDYDSENASGGSYADGDVWRSVYPGLSTAPGTEPTLIVRGGASSSVTTVYVWSEDESVVVPVASGDNTVSTDSGTGKTILAVKIPAGSSSATFALKGADGAAAGSTANIWMSPVRGSVARPTGELVDVAVSRLVQTVTAPAPTARIYLNGSDASATVTAGPDYQTHAATLTFKMTPACSEDVVLDLSATISGASSLSAMYNNNYIRICDTADFDIDGTPTTVTIGAGTNTVTKYVFILGASEDTENGIKFSHAVNAAPSDVTATGTCTLKINRGGEDTPISVTAASPAAGEVTVESGGSKTFTMRLSDTYRSLKDTATGYTVYIQNTDTLENLVEQSGVKANSRGQISVTASSIGKAWNGASVVMYALSPDGLTQTEEIPYTLVVTDSKQVQIAPAVSGQYTVGEGDSLPLALSLNQSVLSWTAAKYIFLAGATAADDALFTSPQTATGAAVGPNAPYTATTSATFLDGASGGSVVTVNAFLGDTQTDPTDVTGGWEKGSISVTVTNKPPVFNSVTFDGNYLTAKDNGTTLKNEVSLGVAKTFSLSATDVAADLNDSGFKVRWMINGQSDSVDVDPADAKYTTFGNPAGQSVTYTFPSEATEVPVFVWIKDKDMSDFPTEPTFYFYVNVKARPGITITTGAVGGIFNETDGNGVDSHVTVTLSERATADIVVRLTVSQAADGGYMKLRTSAGSVEQAVDGEGNEIPGAYDVYFTTGQTTKRIVVSEMDGSNDTLGGLDINAAVTTETENADGVKWCDFYTAAEPVTVRIQNVAPTVIRPTESEQAYTNMNASANTPYDIYYGANDVANDLASNITVVISVDGTTSLTTNVDSIAVGSHKVEFGSEGSHVVEITYTDKDQMVSRASQYFHVRPSKGLQLTAHGPGPVSASTSGHSARYGAAAGRGAGRVYAGDTGPQKVENFTHYYSFGLTANSAVARAFGYKVSGSYDNGSLTPSPDFGIDENGNWTKGTTIDAGDYYLYSEDSEWGAAGYDSFLYAWACNNISSSSFTPETLLAFNMGEQGRIAIPLPPSEDNATSYPVQYWEAVFSREFLAADNCGDINQDGIPDLVVYRYGMGIFSNGQLVESDGDRDLADLSKYNADLDKNGVDAPDFLPVSGSAGVYGQLIPGLNGTWETYGEEFTAIKEIRGYHEGLNDALAQLGITADTAADRVYAEEVDDGSGTTEWQWTENCTISKLEFAAWREYAAANGLDWTSSDAWKKWSPERPTSPILDDTDGDGFTDGYEYYFWYKAHVGWFDVTDGSHKRLTGRRYDPRNPGEGTLITAEEIETLMDPRVPASADSAKTRDTDNDGLPDLLEFIIGTNPFDFDTDGDGLPDGWELMFAGLNPLLAHTSADAQEDGLRNYDGDAMAITSYALELLENPEPTMPELCRYATFAVIDSAGDTDGVQWYATTNTAAAVSNMVDFTSTAVSMWSFKLADGATVAIESTDKPALVDGRLAASFGKDAAFIAAKNADGNLERGWPIYLPAGTAVDQTSYDDAADAVDVYVLTVTNAIPASAANAAWVYGRGTNDVSRGVVADTAAAYGCLALARPKAVPANAVLCAVPSEGRDVALLHYLVYQKCGFDPRTAWSPEDPLSARWGTLVDGEAVEGVGNNILQHPARTRAYRTYDEFLVYSFFFNSGCDMTGYYSTRYGNAPYMAQTWAAFTTNPQGPEEPDRIQLDASEASSAVGWTQYFFGYDNADNGADTDGDGVPDGWELYTMSGPRAKDGSFVFAPPHAGFKPTNAKQVMEWSYFSPFRPFAKSTYTLNENYIGTEGIGKKKDDTLTQFQEFEGTDSIAYYAVARSGNELPFSTTVVHSGEWKWYNKFLPTDPWNSDTDGDGISDKVEGSSFAYGTPADNGLLKCVPGGGLNPCSVDTDMDGLPDPWELQFKGSTQFPGDLPAALAELGNKAKDGDDEIGNYLQGLIDGMDGTVADARNYPIRYKEDDANATNVVTYIVVDGVNQVVNRDYDGDGLDNWQEYMTGMMRCWRYDDPISPWVPVSSGLLQGALDENEASMDALESIYLEAIPGDTKTQRADELWYKVLVDKTSVYYNPGLVADVASGAQYLSFVTNVWDAAYSEKGAAYWFYDRVGGESLETVWDLPGKFDGYQGEKAPGQYACCSPVDADSDHDGMDDYYELFHGMNPLLGASGIRIANGGPCDLVFESWCSGASAWLLSAKENYWNILSDATERLDAQLGAQRSEMPNTSFDFERYPWLNGLAEADADGDGLPNQTEALMPKLASPQYHTDPTALWMTDRGYANSIVSRFYEMPVRNYQSPLSLGTISTDERDETGAVVVDGKGKAVGKETFVHIERDGDGNEISRTVHALRSFPGWRAASGDSPAYFDTYNPDVWSLTAKDSIGNWMYSFEMNEGYDSDHDGVADGDEKSARIRSATDPQDADSPVRRQAMYFQGPDRPSALQTPPRVVENHPVGMTAYPDSMAFRTFTVECWAMPESLEDSVLVERAVYVGQQNPADAKLLRRNFQIGIVNDAGKALWVARFDPYTTLEGDVVEARSTIEAKAGRWTHVAATYDGTALTLYIDGMALAQTVSGALPSYGSARIAVVSETQNYWFDHEINLDAIIVGASAKDDSELGYHDPTALNVMNGAGWNYYARFFKGWIDEVRVWDGARTAAEIAASRKARFTSADALANREEIATAWLDGKRRDDKDAAGNAVSMAAELRYHFSFDSVFGAQNDSAVAIAPGGFDAERAFYTRPENYEIAWWTGILDGYENTVYNHTSWTPWIPNTVAHLPRYDGTTLDSMFWSTNYMGAAKAENSFAREAEPVTFWNQMNYQGVISTTAYDAPGSRHLLANMESFVAKDDTLSETYEFAGRNLTQSGEDLLPLGGAYARMIDNETGLWDGNGASDAWEITGSDADADGLPDWWEIYADENYRPSGMDPAEQIGWFTEVERDGVRMTAGQAYLMDLLSGSYVNASGEAVIGSGDFSQMELDADKSGIPDWWERIMRIEGYDASDDPDGDGLSNLAEYLASVSGLLPSGVSLNPLSPYSDGVTLDYWRTTVVDGKRRALSEIFTDHDKMADDWEDVYGIDYVNSAVWDATSDRDNDGWSNWSEARALTDPSLEATLSLVASQAKEDRRLPACPIPTVRMKVSYDGVSDAFNGSIVVKAWRGTSLSGIPDARWTVAGPDSESALCTRFLGLNPNRVVRLNLGPGMIAEQHCKLQVFDPDGYVVTSSGTTYYDIDTAPWHSVVYGGSGTWYDDPSSQPKGIYSAAFGGGYVDYRTGDVEIDFTKFQNTDFAIDLGGNSVAHLDLRTAFFKVEWMSRVVTRGNVKEFHLAEADADPATLGYLREGLNTFIAFADANGNGEWDAGEPFGYASGVDVGWDETGTVAIELKDDGDGVRFSVPDSGIKSVRIVRTAVNGTETPVRTVWSRSAVDLDIRNWLADADFVRSGSYDFDWTYLCADALNNLGLQPDQIKSAGYAVYAGTNIVSSFTRTFAASRTRPVAVSPSATDTALLFAARPTFVWRGSDEMSAFRIQIASDSEFSDVVWDSGTNILSSARSWTAPVYVGDQLVDGTNYFWRIAEYNARYRADDFWSDPAEFKTRVGCRTRPADGDISVPAATGYGGLSLEVRYFGPAADDCTNVVVGVYESADFAGDPVARLRLGFDGTVQALTNNLSRSFYDVETNAPGYVEFAGIAPGTAVLNDGVPFYKSYCAMAFIDSNGNGRRDAFEPWGYAVESAGSSDPAKLPVYDVTAANREKFMVIMEDTDVNANDVPDCMEPEIFASGSASSADGEDLDLDGLSDVEEDEGGTDPAMWDTDGDGMPDGWEVWAGTDPVTADADLAADGDVMAYAVTNMTVVTLWDGTDADSATNRYAMPLSATVHVGDDASSLDGLCSIYGYGEQYGLGVEVDPSTLSGLKVYSVDAAEVVLVHSQVYEAFGFDATTAVPPVLVVDEEGTTNTVYVTNTVYGANTKPFTALDKYLVARWLKEALGEDVDETVMNTNRAWAASTLKPADLDNDRDGVPDGWELYVGKSPWDFDDRGDDDDGDGLPLVDEYDAKEPFDPANQYSVYDRMSAAGLLLPGTSKFTDAEARRFGIYEDDFDLDDDNDLLTNLEEIQAYYYDRANLADIDPDKAWSDGATPDYFRAAGDTWLGALFNGAEFIEPEIRSVMGIDTLSGAGTRDYNDSGWDAWSTARYSILSGEQTNDVSGVVSDELMLLIRYWNIIRPGEFTGTTVGEAVDFFHEVWGDVDYEGNVVIETTERHEVSGYGTIHHANAAQTTTQIVDFFGGQAKIEEIIAKNKKDMTAADIVTPEPAVDLVVKYAANGSYNLVLEAYQTSSVYPEYGEQLSAQWTTPVKFDAGVAKVNQLKTPGLGSLKQGRARFVAYIDNDGDGKLSAGDTSGSETCEVGYLGCRLVLTLGESNPAFPPLRLASGGSNDVQTSTLALVRTAINGKPLYNSAKGVYIVQFPNNAAREALYPDEYDTGSYIGIDPTLSSLDNLETIESVTYEVLRLKADEVETLSVTNLNEYIELSAVETNGEYVVTSNIVSRQINETVTFAYSLERDVAKSIACAGSTADDFTLTFTVPTDTVNTKFWLNVEPDGASATLYGGTKGFILNDIRGGEVVLDKYWFEANGVSIPTGLVKFGVVLGNDKYGRPGSAACAMAETYINEGASFDGALAVKVAHPAVADADLDGKLTIAAYESADLANPVAVVTNRAAGEAVVLDGLRPGESYYIAAWLVNDATDGRGTAERRMPYDTWGYYCTLAVTNRSQVAGSMAFDAVALKAELEPSATNTVWLQDTDWNANGAIDRDETFRAVDGDYARSVDPVYGFDIEGLDESELFGSDASESDVFAYAEVPFYCVKALVGGSEIWFAVTNLDAETVSDKVTPGIPAGTPLSELKTLMTTYWYDFGKSSAKRLALGTNIVWTGSERVVTSAETPLVLVHAQVYDWFGFDPRTANGYIDPALRVNTRTFTSADKNYVTNYLANVLGWTGDLSAYALPADTPDADPVADGLGDGIPDGWELYVMKVKNGVAVHSPWEFADRTHDADGDGLDLLHEFDGGYSPTDPWDTDTDGDGIGDKDAWDYNIKTGDSMLADDDGDGLSNYTEYLLSKVFNFGKTFDPKNPNSVDPYTPDCFYRVNDLYLGEIFADHDKIEDVWEDAYGLAASRYAYDPAADTDEDGWSNLAEFMAGTDPSRYIAADGVTPAFPVPALTVRVRYNGAVAVSAPIVVESRSMGMDRAPDAVWNVADAVSDGHVWTLVLTNATSGSVREGANTFTAYADIDGNGEYDPATEPYGFVHNVSVGWSGTSVDIELTDFSPVTPRFNLWDAGVTYMGNTNESTGATWEYTRAAEEVLLPENEPVRVRIVRWKLDGWPRYRSAIAPEVVYDKLLNTSVSKVITEADFVADGKFDIDWDNFYSGVVTKSSVSFGNYRMAKMEYLVVVGDGAPSFLSGSDTNSYLTVSRQIVTRHYGTNQVRAVALPTGSVSPAVSAFGVVNTPSPTFSWSMDCPEREGYTAFRLQVSNASGALVYDSGMQRAPARDASGVYRWTAPICAGDMMTNGVVFANKAAYSWKVAMYNAKYRQDMYSDSVSFYMNVEENGLSCASAPVAVRYFGPSASYNGKTVRVQAFASPDFAGRPVAAGYVADTSALAAANAAPSANCKVLGLAPGAYYLKAFIDSDNDGECDEWESSGWFTKGYGIESGAVRPAPVVVGPDTGAAELAPIYIEDADTDADGLPDSWEYASYGSLSAKGVELLTETPAGEKLYNASLATMPSASGPGSTLAVHTLSVMQNAGVMALASGANVSEYDTFTDAISGSVSAELAEDGVKITSLSLADGKVVIKVDAETDDFGHPLISTSGFRVTCRILRSESLSPASWETVKTETLTVGAGEKEIELPAVPASASGFYTVEVESLTP